MATQSYDDEAETPRSVADRNPVLNHEPEGLDSGDQMPGERSLWGDARGHQSQLAGTEYPHLRWLEAFRAWLRGPRHLPGSAAGR